MGQYNVGRRRSIGIDCRGTANLLEHIVEGNLVHMEEVDEQWGVASSKEIAVLENATADLQRCIRRLRALEKRFLA